MTLSTPDRHLLHCRLSIVHLGSYCQRTSQLLFYYRMTLTKTELLFLNFGWYFFCSRIDLKYSWDLVYVAWKLYHYNYFKAREDLRNEKLISGDLPSLFRFDAGRQPFRSMRNRQTGAPWRVAGNKPISRWMVLFAEAAAFAIISGWWMNDKYRQASPFTWIWSRNETERRDQKKKKRGL